MKAEVDGKRIKLTGEASDRKYHDRLIDLLVAMKLYEITNEVRLPKAAEVGPAAGRGGRGRRRRRANRRRENEWGRRTSHESG